MEPTSSATKKPWVEVVIPTSSNGVAADATEVMATYTRFTTELGGKVTPVLTGTVLVVAWSAMRTDRRLMPSVS